MSKKCDIARETADYLTPETWVQGHLLTTPFMEIGDENEEVEFFKENGTSGKYPVCLVGSLIRACYMHIPDYDYNLTEHHDLTQELAEDLAKVIDPGSFGTFGTITQFNDEDEFDEEGEVADRFPTIKDTANRFAEKVCGREA